MKLYQLLLVSVLIISCGGKSKSGDLEITVGALSATSPTMLYGVRMDGTERWGKKLTDEKTTIVLTQGEWKLQAINWSSSTAPMSGTPTCAAQVVTIGGDRAQVDLSLSTDSCLGEHWYNGTGYSSNGTNTYFGSFRASVCPSDVTDAQLKDSAECLYPDSTITGFRVSLPEFKNLQPDFVAGLSSQCVPVTSNILQGLLFLPYGSDRSYPMFTKLELFHASNPACVGEDCCSGSKSSYNFPSGLGQSEVHRTAVFKDQSYVHMKLVEKSDLSMKISHALLANYKSCQPAFVSVRNAQNQPEIFTTATRVALGCTNCTYHLQNGCTDAALTEVSIPANAPDAPVYVHVTGYESRLRASAPDRAITPSMGRIRALITYAQIDHDYLFSGSINDISNQPVTPPFALNDIIVYETRSMNRGKMKINNVFNINLPGDKIYFDFVTYDSGGSIVTQENNTYVTACINADCNIDFDSYPAVGGNVSPNTDIWFQNYGTGIGWFTQSTTFNFLR